MFSEEKYFDTEKLLDEALKTEPQYVLSDHFTELLAEKISRKFAWKQYFTEFLIYFGVIAGLVAVSVAIQFVLFDASWQGWLNFIRGNIAIVIGILFLLVFVLFVDRVLLRYFIYKTRMGSN